MHVLHFYDGHEKVYGGRGSVPDVLWQLAHETAVRGHNVDIIERQWAGLDPVDTQDMVTIYRQSLSTGSDQPYEDIPYEMVSTPVGAGRLVIDRANFALATFRLLEYLDPDVIHVHLPFAANVLVTCAPWLRDRIVYTAHLGETEKRVLEPRFSPDVYLAKRSARTIALNPSMRAAFLKRGVPKEQVELVPNGVDTTQFDHVTQTKRNEVRETHDISGEVIVLFVGTVTPRKGVLELVRAAKQVLPAQGNAELVVVGDTEMEPEYFDTVQTVVADAGIEDQVTFTGFVSEAELAACYDLADVFALPSYEEGSSMSVSEAMAAELPVVGSDIDGIRQRIEHGTHGLLSEPGDVDTLSKHLAQILADADRRERMSTAITERAQTLSWETIAGDMLDVYTEVAST